MKKLEKLFLLPFFAPSLIFVLFLIGCGEDFNLSDPCLSNPCVAKDNTIDGQCNSNGKGTGPFSCNCTEDYFWNTSTQECTEPISIENCPDLLKDCMDTCEAGSITCQGTCLNTYTAAGCQCNVDIDNVPATCGISCGFVCLLAMQLQQPDKLQACVECGTTCVINQCR